MKKELMEFIRENKLSPFNKTKTKLKLEEESIFKTKDAKAIQMKVFLKISSNFVFAETANLLNKFHNTKDINEIKKRKDFVSAISKNLDNSFLRKLVKPKPLWKPRYSTLVVTEDENTLRELQKMGCPAKFLVSQYDIENLENYDIVQVLDCEDFRFILEKLPQTVFLDSIDEAYLERYVEILSGWKENLRILQENKIDEDISCLVKEISSLLFLIEEIDKKAITREEVETKISDVNREIFEEIKNLSISGESLLAVLSKNVLPREMQNIVARAIEKTNLPKSIFNIKIPVEIDEEELEGLIKKQNTEEFILVAEKIKRKSKELQELPKKLQKLSDSLIFYDFVSGISKFVSEAESFPELSDEILIDNVSNLFLEKAQPISFYLSDNQRCSILTGANSGGKTTLLENLIQLVVLFQLGFPTKGKVKLPFFSEVYYFSKNKGSINRGAFENLLLQMSKINPGKKTLILADEIEAVTEPGVAGSIVCASAEYFIKKGCFLVIATHLGKEIQRNLPQYARIDGIEAKGLDENYELIVDHNPVLGRLANSTPELIIEKMASSEKSEYFKHLNEYLKREKQLS